MAAGPGSGTALSSSGSCCSSSSFVFVSSSMILDIVSEVGRSWGSSFPTLLVQWKCLLEEDES